jgi:hypothetical protein
MNNYIIYIIMKKPIELRETKKNWNARNQKNSLTKNGYEFQGTRYARHYPNDFIGDKTLLDTQIKKVAKEEIVKLSL